MPVKFYAVVYRLRFSSKPMRSFVLVYILPQKKVCESL